MEDNPFELRSIHECHSSDVRAVCGFIGKNGFITGSRDKSAKLYIENESKKFEQTLEFHDAKHFISSTLVINFNNVILIFVGSNDGNIYKYKPETSQLCGILEGHTSTVSSLSGDNDYCILISSSWDKTVIVWKNNLKVKELVGHKEAVWAAVIINDEIAITGSADKTIKLWKVNEGKCFKTINGHSDCVRDIKLIKKSEFLSCSNDSLIKRWTINGDLLETYSSHENFIYNLAVIDDTNLFFASCSEDRTLRIWKNGAVYQILRFPCQTVWSVSKTQDNDIVVGCSNGKVYVYTQNKSVQASKEQQKLFKEELSKSVIHSNELKDINVNKLPDKTILNLPGKKEGEVKLINENNLVTAYQWDLKKNEWFKVGDVIGTNNIPKDSNEKKEYEGKFYDYVFEIDIGKGLPLLYLPYNVTQNPWMVAQEFIDKHDLGHYNLDIISNFIINNSRPTSIGESFKNSDPLTKNSSYKPTSSTSNDVIRNEYFPLTNYFIFETLNKEGVEKKIKEFNLLVDARFVISNTDLNILFDSSEGILKEKIRIIKVLMNWPQDYIFPVLDYIRVELLSPQISKDLCHYEISGNLYDVLRDSINNPELVANQYLALRCLCNLFKTSFGEEFINLFNSSIFGRLKTLLNLENKFIQVSLASLYMNFSVYYNKNMHGDYSPKYELAFKIIDLLKISCEIETKFRALVALGTILSSIKKLNKIYSNDLLKLLKNYSNCKKSEKVSKCASYIIDIFLNKKIRNYS